MSSPQSLSISWSALRAHTECKQRTKLVRAGKRSPTSDIRVFFHGTVVDRVMREWLSTDDYPLGAMAASVEAILDREETSARESGDGIVKWRHASDRKEVIIWCKELVTRLEPILLQHVIPFDYEPAKRFKVPIVIPYLDGRPTEINLIGEMDILVRNHEGVFYVWDLKGTADNSYWRKTMGQMVFYSLAVRELFSMLPGTVGLFQPMCKERVMAWTVTDEQISQLINQIIRMAEDLWRQDFPLPDSTSPCNGCQVKHACPRFKKPTLGGALTMDNMRALLRTA